MPDISSLIARHREFFKTGATKPISFRVAALKRLEASINMHEEDIFAALKADLNKSEFESYETELGIVYGELKVAIDKLPQWARIKKVKAPLTSFPAKSYIYPEPYGTVLIMSPWNYPFQLSMIPLIGAIAAGNCPVLKPSAYSPNTSEVIHTIIRESFPEEFISVIQGGRAENTSLLEQKFDYIFFTGSPSVGHVVMQAASKHLTPITLELGGKSPCIVDETANISLAAKSIAWGKLLNAGQTCIAPDYFFVHETIKDALLAEIEKSITEFYGQEPECSSEYPKIVNEKHFKRLCRLMESGNIVYGGTTNKETLKIAPTIIDYVSPESPIMQEEIFGPLFPILTFEHISEVCDFVYERPKPLALYLFTTNEETEKRVLTELSFGGGCINDTIMHIANPYLPFGGVGNSGMGSYHDKRTFDTFTHEKAVLKKHSNIDIPLRYPPFRNKLPIIRKFM